MNVTRRILPHPLLTVTLLIAWFLFVNTVTVGNFVLGLFLAVVIPIITAPYWPGRPKVRNPLKQIEYVLVVLWDILVANVVVAGIVLFKPNASIKSAWVSVPVDLKSAEAITVLAGTITLTPGTVSAMLATDGRSILVHCLHTDDPDAVRDEIKDRYERRLKEIFQ